MSPDKTKPGSKTPFSWPLLAVTLLALGASTLIWYHLGYQRSLNWAQPLLMLGLVALFLISLFSLTRVSLGSLSGQSWIIIGSVLVLLTVLWLFGRTGFYQRNLQCVAPESALTPLYGFIYMSLSCLLLRTVIPLVIIRWRLKGRISDFGYRLGGTWNMWWAYVVLGLAVILVVVFYASTRADFQAKYPFCRGLIAGGTLSMWSFVIYQLFYGLIFLSGESFWRGYIIFGLERDLGYNSLTFMIIPYVLIHFGKPLPETMGALAAGLALGYLALRHRSFWLGVAVHWAVALSMDLSALVRRGIDLV